MDRFAQRIQSLRIEKVMQALKNNMKAFLWGDGRRCPKGRGPSAGRRHCLRGRVHDAVRVRRDGPSESGRYRFRPLRPGLSREQIEDIYREAFRPTLSAAPTPLPKRANSTMLATATAWRLCCTGRARSSWWRVPEDRQGYRRGGRGSG